MFSLLAPAVSRAGQTVTPTLTAAQCANLPELDRLLKAVNDCKAAAGRAKTDFAEECRQWWGFGGWLSSCDVPLTCTTPINQYYRILRGPMAMRDRNALPRGVNSVQAVNDHIRSLCTDPTLSVSPKSDTQLGTFTVTGSNYTLNGTIRRFVQIPGQPWQEISSVTATAAGAITTQWPFKPGCTYPVGTAAAYAIDAKTGRKSPTVTEQISLDPSCLGTLPVRPVNGRATLGFNVTVSWANKPHNGIDYSSSLSNQVVSVGNGGLYAYTKPDASRFGSINPDGKGPAIWQQLTLASGDIIYVLYGHTSDSWIDKSKGSGKTFVFDSTYQTSSPGKILSAGSRAGFTAPFYNGGVAAPHLHMSVFKPTKDPSGRFYGPPSSGWGYSDIKLSTGEYIDPEVFFASYRLR